MGIFIAQQAVNALALTSIYALLGLGVTVIFALTGIVNFAQGAIMVVGGFATYYTVSNAHLGFVPGLLVAVIVTAGLGWALLEGVFRFTLRRPITGFIASLGLIIVIENVLTLVATASPRGVNPPMAQTWIIGRVRVQGEDVLTLAATIILLAAYFLFTGRTRWGRAVRATASDRNVAELMGIPTRTVIALTFAIGSGLAGVGGAFLIALTPMTPTTGDIYIVFAFAVALVGGLGNAVGVVAGALVLGVVTSFAPGVLVSEQWGDSLVYGTIIVILLVRPTGIFSGSAGSDVS